MKEILELFNTFSGTSIIIFIVMLAFAIKGVVTFVDWGYGRLKQYFDKKHGNQENKEKILEKLDSHSKDILEIKEAFAQQQKLINLLVNSDRDDIKAWITEKHHFYCYEKKYIDDYTLDCIEKRFRHYEDEGGNSFVATLMQEIRALPKISMVMEDNNKDKKQK